MSYRNKTRSFLVPLSGALLSLAISAGCSDSDSPVDGDGGGGSGGAAPHAGNGGVAPRAGSAGLSEPEGGAAGANEQRAGAGGEGGEGGEGGRPEAPPIGVNRPERRDFSSALLAQLRTKPGFRVAVFATAVSNARMLALGPEGAVYVTTPMTSQVFRLTDLDDDGDVDDENERVLVASSAVTPALQGVHGIAFSGGKVYLAATKSVVSGTVAADGSFTDLQALLTDLPDGGQHPNRTLAVGPDNLLYVSVGSDCNACAESNSEHASVLRLNLDGSAAANPNNDAHPMLAHNPLSMVSDRVWASGLRNTLGFDWNPTGGTLWGIDQGSDGLGEETPPEEINLLSGGNSYGWPYCWGARNPDPTVDDPSQILTKQQYCPTTTPSLGSGLPAHSSPIAFRFYTGGEFPAEYTNDAFLVLRGSWGRLVPEGYKVVRVHFQNGQLAPLAGTGVPYEDFLAGFLIENGTAHFGRLAGLTFDALGALLVSDDTNGMIYRVSYDDAASGGGGAGAQP
ncbi:MAG TPA: PQQ-dependent sugar dehydrogenase [Polyangiaceae bacterium]|nr:PQQ-dependent sugar dehydrogenase [Polyangiaceae bacterium]